MTKLIVDAYGRGYVVSINRRRTKVRVAVYKQVFRFEGNLWREERWKEIAMLFESSILSATRIAKQIVSRHRYAETAAWRALRRLNRRNDYLA